MALETIIIGDFGKMGSHLAQGLEMPFDCTSPLNAAMNRPHATLLSAESSKRCGRRRGMRADRRRLRYEPLERRVLLDGDPLLSAMAPPLLDGDAGTEEVASPAADDVVLFSIDLLAEADLPPEAELPTSDGDWGTPEGDTLYTMTGTAAPLVVSIPSFARGPGQPVNLPAARNGEAIEEGLLVHVDNAAGITSVYMKVVYDPDLLTVTAVGLGPGAPQGSSIESNRTVTGEFRVAFYTSGDGMASGPADLFRLTAEVPATATYGATNMLHTAELEVNAGDLAATASDGLHVVAYVGDANGNQRYDAEDPRLIARVGLHKDPELAAFPEIDPRILGDVTGDGTLSSFDCSKVLREVVGFPCPEIPAMPEVAGEAIVAADASSSLRGEVLSAPSAVEPIVQAAVAQWATSGLSAERVEVMAGARFVVADLPGNLLGRCSGPTIYLDRDAAGQGWFVDPTPQRDEEFLSTGSQLSAVELPAAGRIDLLTVVAHELGHIAGLPDLGPEAFGLMAGSLPRGIRRLAIDAVLATEA